MYIKIHDNVRLLFVLHAEGKHSLVFCSVSFSFCSLLVVVFVVLVITVYV